uniref:Uncharacterized protein n=1 Tax=Trichuris muris TaxID=70415 RepID=A0A5S6Q2X8_TRIMR
MLAFALPARDKCDALTERVSYFCYCICLAWRRRGADVCVSSESISSVVYVCRLSHTFAKERLRHVESQLSEFFE